MSDLKQQLVGALLVILTVAAVIAAAINLQQQSRYHLPDDGVTWIDHDGSEGLTKVAALHVVPDSPAEKAGIHKGDILVSIETVRIQKSIDATQVLARLGAWRKAEYTLDRNGVEIKANVIIGENNPDTAIYFQYVVGFAYLAIGLFVYFRRGNAPKAVHFYLLCLTSFILSTFHYSGKLNNFDKVIYWGNVIAGLLAPTIFLHFCLTFPEPRKWLAKRWRRVALYGPAAVLLLATMGVALGVVRTDAPLIEMRWLLDRAWLALLSVCYLGGGVVLVFAQRREEDPIVRRQLTWLRNGAILGALPFTLIYVIPYMMGAVPTHAMKMAVLSLPFIPLTWAYAILRYRLMDVDIIFQQGYVYTLATLCVLAIFYGLIISVSKAGDLSGYAMVALVLIATFVFQPIRNWIQEQLDRYYFYKDRYDYRRTLIEFARELGAQTDLDVMLESVADRLIRTLSIRQVAFFVWDEGESQFHLEMACDRNGRRAVEANPGLDLSFLSTSPQKPYLFFERTRHPLDVVSHDWPVSVRQSIADLELTYYLPCSVRSRTIAYLGVSRTEDGDFLSSDDVELLVTLTGYVGIAIDNASLYRSLQHKVEEFERLKEFSENIVESINVGILAADLEDRVESWNTQIERLTGIPREAANSRRLCELFPAELCEKFEAARGQSGVHNIYKFVLEQPHEATVNIAIAPLVAKDNQQIGRLIIFDDVTDRAELERRLVQADKLSSIGLLAAGVAHEVNTPLAVISTYAQMLAKQISGDETKSVLLDKIARQTFRASEIVNSLLSFSRTSPTEFVEINPNRIVRETLTLVEHQLEKARIRVRVALDENLPPIKGNAGKLQQVFLNLLLNARDAMESGGTLAIRTWSEGGMARAEVADSGQGIAPEHVARIFDPFFTTKSAKKGTGLGLSVTYGIVREHGGDIEVESQQGAGTTFRLEFPLARKQAAPQTSVSAARPAVTTPPAAPAAAAAQAPAASREPSAAASAVARSDNVAR